MTDLARARWYVLAAAVSFSTGGTAIKLCGWSGLQVAGGRSLVAAIALLLLVPASRRGWSARMALVSVAYAATLLSFVLSNKLTTAANAIFLQSTSPFYVLLLAPFWLGEPRRTADILVTAMLGVGMVCFLFAGDQASAIATDPVRGNMIALASGVTWAGTVMGMRWLARSGVEGGAEGAAALGNLMVAAVALPLAWPFELGTAVDVGSILWLGVVQIGLSYVWVARGMRHVDALEASVLLMAEPALSPLWAWLVHGEQPAPLAVLGGVILVVTLVGKSLLDRERIGLPPGDDAAT